MPEATKITACLIGPSRGGKSSLLASWIECARQRYDGFSPLVDISVRAIDEADFVSADNQARRRILGARGGEFTKLENQFAQPDAWDSTPTEDTYEYFFRIERTPRDRPNDRRTVLLQIVDAAGEFTASGWGSGADQPADILQKFEDQIREADAIVAVIPLVDFDSAQWVREVGEKLSNLLDEPGKLKRIVIAFTQYERLFVRFGSSAFQFASRQAVARYVVRRYLERTSWLSELRRFETDDRRVRFTVTSAYGFVKSQGNPNLDPHQPREQRFLQPDPARRAIAGDLWRPFLTADPFLYAALGEDSYFTFPFEAVDSLRPADAARRNGAPDERVNGGAPRVVSEAPAGAQRDDRPAPQPGVARRGIWDTLRGYFE